MNFNHNIEAYNTKAANIIVPILISTFNPKSVIDIGCGIGTWLNVFKKNEVIDYLGVDGSYVDRTLLLKYIEEENFYPFDLRNELNLNKKYDIVISLEVAEHIDEKHSDNFIKTLTNHSDTIIFSAAIPFQVGENHINEQWPSYWIEKFEKHNFFPHDIIRPLIWNNAEIEFWYKQNIIVFKKAIKSNMPVLDLVHPFLYVLKTQNHINEINSLMNGSLGLRFYLKTIVNILRNKLFKRWKK